MVPQSGAAPEPLWVQQLQSAGTQHRFWYFWDSCVSGLLRTVISTKHSVVVFCNCCFQIMSPSPSVSICSICLRSCRTATGSTSTPRVWLKLWAWTLASSRYSTTLNWWLTVKETTDFFYFQDAQEFSKLFLSLLENTLSKQKNSSLQNVIQRQFCGQFSYVTVWEDSFWLNIVSVGWTFWSKCDFCDGYDVQEESQM